jgi:HD-GYP domain-containing protein (c-di-GMP phosphodiesterase class II)
VENPSDTVNPHYLSHVLATSTTRDVVVTEDIVSGSGMKLLSKGARIDENTRERLLAHKLRLPLEDCVQVVDGVIPASFEPVAERLLAAHPLLNALCASSRGRTVSASVASLALSLPMQSLLTVQSQFQQARLDHFVGVAILAFALARRLLPDQVDRHRMLATAGLVHDVGELYISPDYLSKGSRLTPEGWRHIVTHPLVGHRVLCDMVGAGRSVAAAVLLHHERLNGFGYPRSVAGHAFALDGQILAAAEWLMALVESGKSPLARARMAERLVPGEFSEVLLQAVASAARLHEDEEVELGEALPLEDAIPRIERLAATLSRFRSMREWIDERLTTADGELREVLSSGVNRLVRIQTSFSSTGLDAQDPKHLMTELASLKEPKVYTEVMTLIGELEWRMRELERDQMLRSSRLLGRDNMAVVSDVIGRLKGLDPADDPVAPAIAALDPPSGFGR